MITAIKFGESVKYILTSDRKSKKPTVWNFRNLTYTQYQCLSRHIIALSKSKKNEDAIMEEGITLALNLCLLEPENFGGSKFERKKTGPEVFKGIMPWTAKTLGQIPSIFQVEMYTFIMGGYIEAKEGKDLKN